MYLPLKIMPCLILLRRKRRRCVRHIVAQLPLWNYMNLSLLVKSTLIIIVMHVNMIDVSYDIA